MLNGEFMKIFHIIKQNALNLPEQLLCFSKLISTINTKVSFQTWGWFIPKISAFRMSFCTCL